MLYRDICLGTGHQRETQRGNASALLLSFTGQAVNDLRQQFSARYNFVPPGDI